MRYEACCTGGIATRCVAQDRWHRNAVRLAQFSLMAAILLRHHHALLALSIDATCSRSWAAPPTPELAVDTGNGTSYLKL
jgi:hypothetical protein